MEYRGVHATGEVQERCIREEYQRGEEGSSFSVWLQRGYLACGWDPCSMRACGAIAACMCVHQASSLQARSTELANEVVRHVLRPSSHPMGPSSHPVLSFSHPRTPYPRTLNLTLTVTVTTSVSITLARNLRRSSPLTLPLPLTLTLPADAQS